MRHFSKKRLYICLCVVCVILALLCLSACSDPIDPLENDSQITTENPTQNPNDNHTHIEEILPAVPATCTSDGYTEGKKCTECGEITLAPTKTAKLAHSPVTVKGTPATCLESGLTDGHICSVCNTVILEQTIIAATGHNMSVSYEADENQHWQKCTGCDQITAKEEHKLGSSDICEVCGYGCSHERTKWQNLSASTCTTNGIDVNICLDCGSIVGQLSLELLPHTTTGQASCTTSVICTVCNTVVEGAKGHTPGPIATCNNPQVCAVCNEKLIDPLGHFETTTPAVPATCTESGLSEGKHCSRCNLVTVPQTSTAPTGHNYKYSICMNCNDTITADEVSPSTLPRIDVNTSGKPINSTEDYTSAKITLSGCEEKFAFSDISAGIRLRGNSTAGADKKPYRIKFDKKQGMLGLNDGNKFKSWVLLADYFDSTMLRNYTTFSLADILNGGRYFSSDCTPVEVYLNGRYQGVYLLCEQTQIDNDRVNIYEREDTDTSLEIGYLLVGQGGRTDEPNTVSIGTTIVTTDRNGTTMYAGGGNFSLSGGDYTDEQIAYVKKYVEGVYNVIHQAINNKKYYTLDKRGNLSLKTTFVGKTETEKQIETIDAVFNIDACVRLCILDEIVKNLDAGTYNMYVDLSPEGDGRLTLGPPWDFDFALANTNYYSTHSPTEFYATNFTYSDGMRVNTMFVLFGNLPWFEDMIKDVWEENVDKLYGVANNISVMTALYGEQYQKDYAYWNRSLIFHHCTDCHSKFTCHADAVEFLSDWLYDRLDWLDYVWGDGEMPEPPQPSSGLEFDFTNSNIESYLGGFNNCNATMTNDGLKVTVTEGYDPYFTLDISRLPESFYAENYRYLEIEFMLPDTNSRDPYNNMEIFLCAGSVVGATGGVSVAQYLRTYGQDCKLNFNLALVPQWQGEIHSIRLDFVSSCVAGDVIYIKSIRFHN